MWSQGNNRGSARGVTTYTLLLRKLYTKVVGWWLLRCISRERVENIKKLKMIWWLDRNSDKVQRSWRWPGRLGYEVIHCQPQYSWKSIFCGCHSPKSRYHWVNLRGTGIGNTDLFVTLGDVRELKCVCLTIDNLGACLEMSVCPSICLLSSRLAEGVMQTDVPENIHEQQEKKLQGQQEIGVVDLFVSIMYNKIMCCRNCCV